MIPAFNKFALLIQKEFHKFLIPKLWQSSLKESAILTTLSHQKWIQRIQNKVKD